MKRKWKYKTIKNKNFNVSWKCKRKKRIRKRISSEEQNECKAFGKKNTTVWEKIIQDGRQWKKKKEDNQKTVECTINLKIEKKKIPEFE